MKLLTLAADEGSLEPVDHDSDDMEEEEQLTRNGDLSVLQLSSGAGAGVCSGDSVWWR